ncbi:putative DNA ligase-like protein [compost metagenome]
MPLKDYHRKRDFKHTTEPLGKKKVPARKKENLMFVVQEHHASHLHYDFRLEWDGVLKSWAVPKGPSLDPKLKRLAVEVEDHPLEYGKFEGVIPEKHYGAGEVYIWDSGIWIPRGDARAGFKKGHLEFELKGKKLKGTWDLIRTRMTSRTPQWLLIKREDSFVKKGDIAEVQNAKSTHSRRRRRKAQMEFVAPELALLVEKPPEGREWIHETKFDGYRMQAHLRGENVKLFTRTGLDWAKKFPSVSKALEALASDGTVLDGEVVWLEKTGRTSFQKLQNAIKSNDHSSMFYYIFDILSLEGEDLRQKSLMERKKILKEFLKNQNKGPLRYSDHLRGNAKALFKEACSLELEGLISKRADSKYLSGRNQNWLKIKCGKQQEFVIGGYTEAQGSRSGFGALLLGVYERDKLRYVGKVGTGFTETSLRELKKTLLKLEQDHSPFDVKSPRGRGLHWIQPIKSAEIHFSNWTEDGHLRVPVFHGLREDKPPREISVEEPAPPKVKGKLSLSSPEKIIFAKEKITKLDIAKFYLEISEKMLPYVKDRPLALLRCPEGTSKPCFFQKHINGNLPAHIQEVLIKEKTEESPYMFISSSQGLVAFVQMGAFEMHCWNCKKNNVEYPDQIVMDFDPGPGVPWSKVIAAAFELKKTLEVLGLRSFVKLSGGKGVHVHVPISPKYTWDEVKAFSKALADDMEARNPDLYVARMSKKIRRGRIFVDYLRNGRGSTAIGPYCLRARALSSVAMPVTWEELKKIKGPDIFTLEKALVYLKKRKKDPWEGYFKLRQSISLLHKARSKSKATSESLSI